MVTSTRRGPRAVDLLVAVAFTTLTLVVTSRIADEQGERFEAATVVFIVAIGAALGATRRYPRAALALIVGCLVAYSLAEMAGGPVYLAPIAPMYVVASTRGRDETVAAGAATIAVLVLVALFGPDIGQHLLYIAAFTGWVVGAVFLGSATANRRAYLAQLEERARWLEESREDETRRRVAEERLRIARDLHDVIAHGIATINLQSGVAEHILDRHPEQVRPSLLAIKSTSKDVLDELRAMLHVVRSGDAAEGAPLAPTPGLTRLEQLLATARHAGLEVDVRIDGDLTGLPTGVDVAAYRIVQESLTNVMRHAAAREVTVSIVRSGDRLEIDVADDGLGAAAALPPDSVGFGIDGMRERAEAVGGHVDAGLRSGGGFLVRARLPVAAGEPAS